MASSIEIMASELERIAWRIQVIAEAVKGFGKTAETSADYQEYISTSSYEFLGCQESCFTVQGEVCP
jgi:hypothetical protein